MEASLTKQSWGALATLPDTTTTTPPPGMVFAGWAETPTEAVIRGAYRGPASYNATVTLYAVWKTGSRNWISIAFSSDGDRLAAVVKGGGIYTSRDSGASWVNRSR